jgi:hypothetical protein
MDAKMGLGDLILLVNETGKAVERKDRLLRQALDALKSVEWDVNIGIIADIEKELSKCP